MMTMKIERYSRQIRFEPVGEVGQLRLCDSIALIVGCGALGTASAEMLVRAGVNVRIIDNDIVEESNLQRQSLFDEKDIDVPKHLAASRKLSCINSDVVIDAIDVKMDINNADNLVDGVRVIIDCTDNFETRFIINDTAIRHGVPWIYGACGGATGMMMPIIKDKSPCLRCLFPDGAEQMPSPDQHGIISPAVKIVASLQVSEALKILTGNLNAVSYGLTTFDLWDYSFKRINLGMPRPDCPLKRQL
jgi:adenylyltransferase/sulfurtransferase